MAPSDDIIRPSRDRRPGSTPSLPRATRVELSRTNSDWTDDEFLWEAIRDRSTAISYDAYADFMDRVLEGTTVFGQVGAYDALRTATKAFLMHEAGLVLDRTTLPVDAPPQLESDTDRRRREGRIEQLDAQIAELLDDRQRLDRDHERLQLASRQLDKPNDDPNLPQVQNHPTTGRPEVDVSPAGEEPLFVGRRQLTAQLKKTADELARVESELSEASDDRAELVAEATSEVGPATTFALAELPADASIDAQLQGLLQGLRLREDLVDERDLHDFYLESLGDQLSGGKVLPYHKLVLERLRDLPSGDIAQTLARYGANTGALERPVMVELIWSYWHEEGMLAQTFNALLGRFQNVLQGPGDPLLRFDLDPLRPVNNLLWGWIQDEQNRLTVQRRAYEYLHAYGISLDGKAVGKLQPADTRSQFIHAFHDLLSACQTYFDNDDDTTVVADAFPVLNALRDVHVILAEGAHNQYGDLPWTARMEMMMSQWILARPQLREFLGGRTMVPYREPWMDRVDAMKQVQGWGETSVSHFRDLAFFGERILLSVRFGNWNVINDQVFAANWARFWRPEIQTYMHAYRSVTGVDLTGHKVETDVERGDGRYAPPSAHLRRELDRQRSANRPQAQISPRASARSRA